MSTEPSALLAVLRVDADGLVVAANDAARELLGHPVGWRCCDAVLARSGREVRCEPRCAVAMARGEADDRSEPVVIRGRLCVLSCTRVGTEVVVVVRPGPSAAAVSELLTPREREVLSLVAAGASSAEMARRLGLHASTVRTHVERARQKLGARTRAEAVARAIERGEISPPFGGDQFAGS